MRLPQKQLYTEKGHVYFESGKKPFQYATTI